MPTVTDRSCRIRTGRRIGALLVPLFLVTLAAPAGAAARFVPADRLEVRKSHVSLWPRMSTNLQQLFDAQARSGRGLATVARSRGVRTLRGRVVLDLVLSTDADSSAQAIEAAGGTIRSLSVRNRRASVAVSDATGAARIAALPQVQYVYPEYGAVIRAGSVRSRAFEALEVDAIGAGSGVNLTGRGQRIGILSDSFARTNDVVDTDTQKDGDATIGTGPTSMPVTLTGSRPQDSDDLPASVELRKDDAGGSPGDEGAAMAELIHDLAPDAELFFYTAFVSFGDFAAGMDDLCGPAGADVVVDDVGYLNELMYQRDILSRAAKRCVDSGVAYFSSAGNNGDVGFRDVFRDLDPTRDDEGRAGIFPVNDIDLHDWGGNDPFLRVDVPAGRTVFAVLQWNQPALSVPENVSNGPRVDLDLYALDGTGAGASVTHASLEDQRAGDATRGADPIEIIGISAGGSTLTRFLIIDHWAGSQDGIPQDAGTDLEFRLVFFGLGQGGATVLRPGTNDPSGPTMYGHPVADGVISVGAVPWWEAPPFDPTLTGSNDIDPEPFTATGDNLQHHFRPDGSFRRRTLGPRPTVAAVDGNNTTFFGQPSSTLPAAVQGAGFGEPDAFPNFFGTSASAPNAAAVGALLMQASAGAFTPAEIEAKLRSSATDVIGSPAAAGCDGRTGSGLVNARLALAASDRPPVADAGVDQNADGGDTVTLDGSASRDDNLIAVFRWTQVAGPEVNLSNPGGAQTDFDAPGGGGTLVFELRVIDSACLSGADRIEITVRGVEGGGASNGWLLLIAFTLVLLRRCREL